MEIGIGPGNFDRLIPLQRMGAGQRLPMKLDKMRVAVGCYQPESIHAETLHRPVTTRDSAI